MIAYFYTRMHCPTTEVLKNALKGASVWRRRPNPGGIRFEIFHEMRHCRQDWEQIAGGQNAFLQPDYLEAMQRTSDHDMELCYAVFKNGHGVCGIAAFQVTGFDAPDLSTNLSSERPLVGWITRSLRPALENHRVLICGNAFATGEHGFIFREDVALKDAMEALCHCITDILKNKREAGHKISAVLIKDFYPRSFEQAKALENCGFRAFNVDHNMVMPIDGEWKTFDDYLQALVTKFRTKANAAMSRSASLKVKECDANAIMQNADRINQLFHEVHDKADFKLGQLSAETFANMKMNMGERFTFHAYYLNETIVGFRSSVFADQCMDAHMVGIDYTINKEYALYSRMLYDFIAEAIDRKVCRIVFGRTAGEIKSTVGALPVDLVCLIRHPGRVSNLLLTLLFRYVQPSSFPIRQPYKKEVAMRQERMLQMETGAFLRSPQTEIESI